MPSWLVENPTPVYLILGLLALAFGFGLWTTRRGKYLIGLVAVVALGLLVFLLDRLIVTDAEQVQQNIQMMAAGVEAKNMEGTFALVSPRFRVGGMDKATFREWAERRIRGGDVTSLVVWNFAPPKIDRQKWTATVDFSVKGHGSLTRGEFFRCRARLARESDGVWRLTGFDLFAPEKDPSLAQPLQFPL